VAVETDWEGDDLIAARWGPTGYALWVKFLQACKRSTVEGRVSFRSEEQLRSELRISGWELLDDGKPFGLEEFFRWTGVRKWTRRHRRGWPSIECLDWDELQRRRPIRAGSMQDPGNIPTRSRHSRRSEGRNAHSDKTGQDRTAPLQVVRSCHLSPTTRPPLARSELLAPGAQART
jgi:hypothetical protein